MQETLTLVVAISFSVTCILTGAQTPKPNRKHKNPPPTPNTVDPQFIAKLAAAKKPAVGQPLVIGGKTVCGAKGNTPDPKMQELNNNKNRTDEPGSNDYVTVSWSDMNNLPADRVNDIQGAPVSVVGYLSSRVKEQTGAPGESTNCNLLNPDEWIGTCTSRKDRSNSLGPPSSLRPLLGCARITSGLRNCWHPTSTRANRFASAVG